MCLYTNYLSDWTNGQSWSRAEAALDPHKMTPTQLWVGSGGDFPLRNAELVYNDRIGVDFVYAVDQAHAVGVARVVRSGRIEEVCGREDVKERLPEDKMGKMC
jgi:hypothetical protein